MIHSVLRECWNRDGSLRVERSESHMFLIENVKHGFPPRSRKQEEWKLSEQVVRDSRLINGENRFPVSRWVSFTYTRHSTRGKWEFSLHSRMTDNEHSRDWRDIMSLIIVPLRSCDCRVKSTSRRQKRKRNIILKRSRNSSRDGGKNF